MKIRRIMLGVLMMVCVISSEASAWWWQPQPTVPVPPVEFKADKTLSETVRDVASLGSPARPSELMGQNPELGALIAKHLYAAVK